MYKRFADCTGFFAQRSSTAIFFYRGWNGIDKMFDRERAEQMNIQVTHFFTTVIQGSQLLHEPDRNLIP